VYALVSRLGLLFVAVAGTAAGVGWHVAGAGQPLTRGVTDWWLMPVMAAVAYAGTGGWLTRRRPDLPIGWLLLTIGAGSAVYAACLEYGLAVLARDPPGRPGPRSGSPTGCGSPCC
jgi:two-component system, NarL family, sensor kinase